MITSEPRISVGIYEQETESLLSFHGTFLGPHDLRFEGDYVVRPASDSGLALTDPCGAMLATGRELHFRATDHSTFTLRGVTIGIHFHWERKEDQTFEGDLRLLLNPHGTITAINDVSVELYLKSVISSEMSAEAPLELLRAHAITSRSWLVAMLERQKAFKNVNGLSRHGRETAEEIIRWYDREDHTLFDVCADDHCQRYQGITKIISAAADQAVRETCGEFLVYENVICDARYYKSCGGRTELFENSWEETPIPYLSSISDSANHPPAITSEEDAERWIFSTPDAYCNTTDGKILRQVLPSFDQETTDFFRWKVVYTQEQISEILRAKSGIDFGTILDLVPLLRGPSGRIYRLRIQGTKRSVIVGKELEIRRWLSRSHLYSGAFVVRREFDALGIPTAFTLHGAGWGHGVGLCQIGAAVMASKGFTAEEIVKHYFRGAELKKVY